MGWGRWFLLGDIGQQMDLADQDRTIDELRQRLLDRHKALTHRMDELAKENDELKLYVAALLRLLIAKQVATREEVRALVEAVDREDGARDQRYMGELP
jgi:hypothetical protein